MSIVPWGVVGGGGVGDPWYYCKKPSRADSQAETERAVATSSATSACREPELVCSVIAVVPSLCKEAPNLFEPVCTLPSSMSLGGG